MSILLSLIRGVQEPYFALGSEKRFIRIFFSLFFLQHLIMKLLFHCSLIYVGFQSPLLEVYSRLQMPVTEKADTRSFYVFIAISKLKSLNNAGFLIFCLRCSCNSGFVIDTTDPTRCVDINECLTVRKEAVFLFRGLMIKKLEDYLETVHFCRV